MSYILDRLGELDKANQDLATADICLRKAKEEIRELQLQRDALAKSLEEMLSIDTWEDDLLAPTETITRAREALALGKEQS